MTENKFIKVNISDKELRILGKKDLNEVKNDVLNDMISQINLDINKKNGEKLKLNEFEVVYDKEKGIHSFILKYNY